MTRQTSDRLILITAALASAVFLSGVFAYTAVMVCQQGGFCDLLRLATKLGWQP